MADIHVATQTPGNIPSEVANQRWIETEEYQNDA